MPAERQSFTAVEIKAGLLVLASAVVFAVFVAVLSGMRPPEERTSYYCLFSDTLGLSEGAYVRFGGAKAGRVTSVVIDEETPTQIRVGFEMIPEAPVNAESVAFIGQTTLTAEKHLEITTGSSGAQRLPEGSQVPTQQRDLFGLAGEVGAELTETLEAVQSIFGADLYAATPEEAEASGKKPVTPVPQILENIDAAVVNVREVITGNRENIDQLVERMDDIQANAQGLIEDLRAIAQENREDVRGAVSGVRATVEQAQQTMGQVDRVVADVAEMTGELDALADTLQSALDHSEELAAGAKETVEEMRPEIQQLVRDLRQAAANAREFARAVAEQPQSILRGQEPVGRRIE